MVLSQEMTPFPEQRRGWYRRRKARLLGNGWVPYRGRAIYERDGWACHVCLRRVDPSRTYPDSLSATIDHLIPLAEGGPDTPENVRLAHLCCNKRRGTWGAVQLILSGEFAV